MNINERQWNALLSGCPEGAPVVTCGILLLLLMLTGCAALQPPEGTFIDAVNAGDVPLVERHWIWMDAGDHKRQGFYGLQLAASHGDTAVVEVLLRKNVPVTRSSGKIATPLHYAAGQGHADIVLLLLNKRSPVNGVDRFDKTPLHWAADGGHVEAARVFAERILDEGGKSTDERLTFAYQVALTRSPDDEERAIFRTLLESTKSAYREMPEAATALVEVGLSPRSQEFPALELASWTAVARGLINLNESITRN